MLEAQRQRQWRGHAGVELAPQVEVVGPLAGLELPGLEGQRRRARIGKQRDIGRIGHAQLGHVLAVGARQIPVPVAKHLALDADRERIVFFVERLLRAETQRVDRRQAVGHAVVLKGPRFLLAVGGKAVQLGVAAQVHAEVGGKDVLAVLGVALDLVQVRVARRIDKRRHRRHRRRIDHTRIDPAALREAVVLRFRCQREISIGERGQADIGHAVARVPAAVHVATAIHVGAAAAVVGLEDDVDDAGNGVGAVLRGRAVLQHFDALDCRHRDEVQVGRGAALEGTGQHGQVGGAVPALAVDQHQRVVRRQAAQARRQRHRCHVATEGLGIERRQVLRQGLDQVGLAGAGQRRCVQNLDR